ncbi:hypothetical protein [Candidatus Protochlamydia phocaeensis]|uniref:hypothetical protein n=1 Tax=Candidatus Protochlamydia phocaeensis TaxID=1414722 RepID=UPI00083899B9|nr:hypothetical protein [Candidatus Protochlamydia phocaeensis]
MIDPVDDIMRSSRMQAFQQWDDYLDQMEESRHTRDLSTSGHLKGHTIRSLSKKTTEKDLFLHTINPFQF